MLTNKKQYSQLSLEKKIELSSHIYIVKNTIYLSNVPNELFSKDILYLKKYLGQYGHINQILFDKKNKKENKVIIKFDTVNQAALAILSLDNFELNNGFKIKIMYYLTKFCNYYLSNRECLNQNCLFIHNLNINEYQYERIKNINQLNSFQYALDILSIPKEIFEIIKIKLIEDKFYEKYNKFPKLSIKKLKNQEYIKKIYPIAIEELKNKNNKKNKENNFKNELNENSKNSSEDDSTIDSYKNKNSYIPKIKRRNNSRFDFIKKENDNNNLKVIIPEFVLDFIDKSIFFSFYINNNNIGSVEYIKDFNDNWIDILFGINQSNLI